MPPSSADELPTLVARAALNSDLRTLQVLAEGPAGAGLQLPVDQLLGSCSQLTVTAAEGTATTVELAGLDTSALGDAAAGLRVTVTHPEASIPVLVGVVSVDARAVLLVQPGAAGGGSLLRRRRRPASRGGSARPGRRAAAHRRRRRAPPRCTAGSSPARGGG
jgi:hypothetical protein